MTVSTPRTWSPQQQNVLDWVEFGTGSAIVEAVAGAGKTTTLIEAVGRMHGSVAFAAYNKKIADEIKGRLATAQMDPAQVTASAGTFHSFGFGAWRRVAPGVRVDDRKMRDLLSSLPEGTVPEGAEGMVLKAVSLAKQWGIGALSALDNATTWWQLIEHFDLTGEVPEGVEVGSMIPVAQDLLNRSNATCHEVIDFDDMIYAPLYHKARLWQNDWVLVDEAQDTNPARRALARRMLKPAGRLIAVGDPHQAIYGFTGADSDALDLIEQEFRCVRLPLTVTYRCPQRVVQEARQYVSHITAHPTAPEGQVLYGQTPEGLLRNPPGAQDVILCRNTKPLVETAFALIRRGVGCRVEGKDIGQGLINLTRKWRVRSCETLRVRLETWAEREVARLVAKGRETAAEALTDRVETLYVLMDGVTTVPELHARIRDLFGDSATDPRQLLTLSTVHKAKGREWGTVYLLGANRYMPSRYARQEWQKLQEANLIYVALTRAQQRLIYVDVEMPAKERAG